MPDQWIRSVPCLIENVPSRPIAPSRSTSASADLAITSIEKSSLIACFTEKLRGSSAVPVAMETVRLLDPIALWMSERMLIAMVSFELRVHVDAGRVDGDRFFGDGDH